MALIDQLLTVQGELLPECSPSLRSLILEPEVVNNALNVTAIGLTLYVTYITKKLDKEVRDGESQRGGGSAA